MAELSIIMPYVNEWPQAAFTIASISEELRDEVDFEIITVDNYVECAETNPPDKLKEHLDAIAKGTPWLKSLEYKKKLSHWQSKNHAIQNSTGKFLWFCDSHCVISKGSLVRMFNYYKDNHEELNGTIHLPLTYHILEWRKLIYKLVDQLDTGVMHYSFTGFKPDDNPYRVSCMSTCGMMMSRALYDLLGGWPKEMGIYGGGEHFINFTLAVLGKTINIWPDHPLRHHGDKRGYSYRYDDYHRNRMIATYMFGGKELLYLYARNCKGDQATLHNMAKGVEHSCIEHRNHIKLNQQTDITSWSRKIKEPGVCKF